MRRTHLLAAAALGLGIGGGCKSIAVNALADGLSGSGGGYATEDDPELVAAAAPFGLKTMESLLAQTPEHVGLLTALASGFVQYTYAFIDLEADVVAEEDIDRAMALERRARKLYRRAREYGLRGLEVEHEGFREALRSDPEKALAEMGADDVPLLYWTAAAWGLLISSSKNEPSIIADFPLVEHIARRALTLDEAYGRGALHELFISLESSRPGGDAEAARRHFERALELSGGTKVGTYVSFAESVCVQKQDSREFHRLIDEALSIDVDASPDDRLVNVLMRRKAERLKATSGDLFIDDVGAQTSTAAPGAS